jgi:hypothetical protein
MPDGAFSHHDHHLMHESKFLTLVHLFQKLLASQFLRENLDCSTFDKLASSVFVSVIDVMTECSHHQ